MAACAHAIWRLTVRHKCLVASFETGKPQNVQTVIYVDKPYIFFPVLGQGRPQLSRHAQVASAGVSLPGCDGGRQSTKGYGRRRWITH